VQIHFALLQLGTKNDLEDIFPSDLSISNQSERAIWNDPFISDAPIFVIADFEQGPDDTHYGPHRYMISAYVLKPLLALGDRYYLEDRFMTVRHYDLEADANAQILASEKQEILARLKRVKAEAARRRAAPGSK